MKTIKLAIFPVLAVLLLGSSQIALAGAGSARTIVSTSFELRADVYWIVTEQATGADSERLALTDGISTVLFESRFDSSKASSTEGCVRHLEADLSRLEEATWMAPLLDQYGNPVEGGDDARRYAVFRYAPDVDDPTVEQIGYLECRAVRNGSGSLAIVAISPAFAFAQEAPLISLLLEKLDTDPDSSRLPTRS